MLNTTARQNTTPRTVLVVEDEPTLATAIAQRITAEVKGVNRVLYDLTPTPSGTVEWE